MIATLGGISSGAALERLTTLAAEQPVAEDACAAIVRLAARSNADIPDARRRAALQMVVDKSKSQAVKERARGILKEIPGA